MEKKNNRKFLNYIRSLISSAFFLIAIASNGLSADHESSNTFDQHGLRWRYAVPVELSDNIPWHSEGQDKIKIAYRMLQELDSESLRNVATFRLMLNFDGEQISRSYDEIIFVSGGNEKITKDLELRFQKQKYSIKTQCVAHYCPTIPSKPKDFELRKNIVEFFELKEVLTKRQKDEILDAFSDCLNARDYFEEFILSEKSKLKIQESLSHSLLYRQFDEESNAKAHRLGLIDKTLKDEHSYEHINDLFGKNFQLNFGDSEQTIRMFIGKLSNEKFPYHLKKDSSLSKLVQLNDICNKIRDCHTEYSKNGMEETLEQLKSYEKIVIPAINQWVRQHLQFHVDIASYYDMCENCWATFQYDFENKNHIARSILFMFLNTIRNKTNDHVVWCIKGWAYDFPKSGLVLEFPKINLLVSSLIKYGD